MSMPQKPLRPRFVRRLPLGALTNTTSGDSHELGRDTSPTRRASIERVLTTPRICKRRASKSWKGRPLPRCETLGFGKAVVRRQRRHKSAKSGSRRTAVVEQESHKMRDDVRDSTRPTHGDLRVKGIKAICRFPLTLRLSTRTWNGDRITSRSTPLHSPGSHRPIPVQAQLVTPLHTHFLHPEFSSGKHSALGLRAGY